MKTTLPRGRTVFPGAGEPGAALLELLASLLITLLIGLSIIGVFYSGRHSQAAGRALAETSRGGRAALDVMSREISAMFISPPNSEFDGMGLVCDGSEEGEFRFYALLGGHSGDWDLCRVGYRYVGEKRQVQRMFNVNPHASPGESWQPLVSNVNRLEFLMYPDDVSSAPSSSWDSFGDEEAQGGRLPRIVRVRITLQDGGRLFEERTFIIRIPVPAAGRRVFNPRSGREL